MVSKFDLASSESAAPSRHSRDQTLPPARRQSSKRDSHLSAEESTSSILAAHIRNGRTSLRLFTAFSKRGRRGSAHSIILASA